MEQVPARELERTMKVQEVVLRAIGKKITWWQAAEILGVSERTMRRWKWGYETHGFRALFDKRKGKPNWMLTKDSAYAPFPPPTSHRVVPPEVPA
jgi:transposase